MSGDIELEQHYRHQRLGHNIMYNGVVGMIHTTNATQKTNNNNTATAKIRKRSNNNKDHRPLLGKGETTSNRTIPHKQNNNKNNKSDDEENVDSSVCRRDDSRTEQQTTTTATATKSITRMASLLYDTLTSSDEHHTYHPLQDADTKNATIIDKKVSNVTNSVTTQTPNQPTGGQVGSSLSRSSSRSSSPIRENGNENECLLLSHLPLHRSTSETGNNNNDSNSQRSSTGSVQTPCSSFCCCCISRSTSSSIIQNRNCGIILFGITTILLFADQNLMAPNLSAIADDFNMTDMERDVKLGGQIAFAFFMIGAPASLIFGYLTDHPPSPTSSSAAIRRLSRIKLPSWTPRFNRRTITTISKPSNYRIRLFATTVVMGETACFMTAFVQTYGQLFLCRALTGFSIGGAFPIMYSLLGEWYEPKDRHWVNALTGIGTGAGVALGQVIAGFLGPVYGWRLPFIIVSLPAIILAVVITIVVQEPERGATEGGSATTSTTTASAPTPVGTPIDPNALTIHDNDDVEQQQQQQLYVNDANESSSTKMSQPIRQDSNNIEITKLSSPLASTSNNDNVGTINTTKDENDTESCVSNHNRSNSAYTAATQQSQDHSIIPDTLTVPVPTDALRVSSNDSPNDNTIPNNNSNNAPNTTDWRVTLRILFTTPTVIIAFLQGAPGCIPWGIINTYLNDYLSSDRGMSVQAATMVLLVFGLSNFAGQFIGGFCATYLYKNWDIRYPALLACFSAILGCIPFYFLLHIRGDVDSWFVIGPIAILAGLCSSVTGPIIKATLQNVTMPHHRGQAFGLFNIADDFGRGLGPVYVAGLIQITKSRTVAFSIGTIGWVICGLLNGLVYFFVKNDEQKAQYRYAQYLESLEQQQEQEQQQQTISAAVATTSTTPTTETTRTESYL